MCYVIPPTHSSLILSDEQMLIFRNIFIQLYCAVQTTVLITGPATRLVFSIEFRFPKKRLAADSQADMPRQNFLNWDNFGPNFDLIRRNNYGPPIRYSLIWSSLASSSLTWSLYGAIHRHNYINHTKSFKGSVSRTRIPNWRPRKIHKFKYSGLILHVNTIWKWPMVTIQYNSVRCKNVTDATLRPHKNFLIAITWWR